ncbi:MAG TPA: hypothetical protein VH413_21045 [Verrucomicrobiae bacterium]|nr:hypothetical protein [Verrucomicrobiae bacterium]
MEILHIRPARKSGQNFHLSIFLGFLSFIMICCSARGQTQPANSLSISTYGATTASADNTTAIQNCFNAAQSQGKSAWIPAGTFQIKGSLNATGITIAGAGMTSSIIYRNQNSSDITATQLSLLSCTVKNLGIDGNGTSRGVNASYGINIKGVGWLIENVQIHHADAGVWASGSSGTVENCILTNTFADGVNINNAGTSPNTVGANLTIQNCIQTGAGDDGFAINAQGEDSGWQNMVNPKVLNCTSLNDDGANGIRIAGGSNALVSGCLVSNTVLECGIVASSYGTGGFGITNGLITGNTVYGCGTVDAAACIGTGDARTVATFTSNILYNSSGAGFQVGTPTYPNAGKIVFGPGNIISNAAGAGIAIQSGVVGSGLIITNTVLGLHHGQKYFVNNSSTFTAIVMGNNWQGNVIPSPPSGLTASVANKQAGLSWVSYSGDISSAPVSYNIKRSLTNGGPYSTVATNIASTSYNDSGLNNGTTYYYVVSGVNEAGEGADSAQVSATPQLVVGSVSFKNGTFTGTSVLSLAGTPAQEVYGVSLGDNTPRTTANGYSFDSYPSVNASYGGSSAYGFNGFLGGGGTSGDSGFDGVLNNGELGINGGTLTLSNLSVGTIYNVLFLEADTRNVGTRTFTITSGSTSSAAQSYAFAAGSPSLGGYILCTFTATNSTPTFTYPQATYGYQLNAILVTTTTATTSPSLSYSLTNGVMQFTWPSDHVGWQLEEQTNAPGGGIGPNWFIVPASNTTNQIRLPASTNGNIYFRLVRP